MSELSADRTHDATPHRRRQARQDGNVARSQDVGSAAILLGATATLWYFGRGLLVYLQSLAVDHLGGDAWLAIDPDTAAHHWYSLATGLATTVLPILALLTVLAVLANVVQVGILFLPGQVAPDVGRIDPLRGLARLFSLGSLARLGFGIAKIAVVGAVAGYSLYADRQAVLATAALDTPELARSVAELVVNTLLKIGGALLALAVCDYAFQWWRREQDLKMTTQEVRDELKNLQGSPQVAARRRAVRRQLTFDSPETAVPRADVVVTNPGDLAVAIQYDPATMDSPRVVAKGVGELAEHIRRLAAELGIPIVEKKPLARALFNQVELGQPIAAAHFVDVAEIVAYARQVSTYVGEPRT